VTPQEAFHFFKVNRDAMCIGRVALEAFGGIRFSTAGKLGWEHIHFDEQEIVMPSSRHKSRKWHARQGQPLCLWDWLLHGPKAGWNVTFRQYADIKKQMFIRAEMKPVFISSPEERQQVSRLRNVWRHSFASYLLAKVRAFGPVSYLMQHTKQDTTERYQGRARALAASLYFGITPESVLLSWEDYLEVNGPRKVGATATDSPALDAPTPLDPEIGNGSLAG
jgi:integrase